MPQGVGVQVPPLAHALRALSKTAPTNLRFAQALVFAQCWPLPTPRTEQDDYDQKASVVGSHGDLAGGLRRCRNSSTDHAANYDDDHHSVPSRNADAKRWDVPIADLSAAPTRATSCNRWRRKSLPFAPAIRAAIIIASANSLVGCGIQAPRLPIAYVPQQNVQPIKGADAVSVEVKVEDLQPELFNDYLSYPLMPSERHFLVKDAAATIKDATEAELTARGFKIGTGGASITIQLAHFESKYEIDPWWKSTARGDLSMSVQVSPQSGKVLYSKNIGGEPAPIRGLFFLHEATNELQGSLEDGLNRLFADPAFTAAILATRQPPQAKPAVPVSR